MMLQEHKLFNWLLADVPMDNVVSIQPDSYMHCVVVYTLPICSLFQHG